MPLEDWMIEVEGMDKPLETGEVCDMQIVSTAMTGPTALVKAAELYAGLLHTVYLSLMQFGAGWKVISKLYHIN